MQLYTQISGEGDAVVLIHGLFGSHENLGAVAKALAEQWQVINIDVRNHGNSAHSTEMTYDIMAKDLAETLAQLGIQQATVLGHSMGGKMAMQYALRFPQQVRQLICADIAPVAYDALHNKVFNGLNAVDLTAIHSRADADKQLAKYIEEQGVRQFLLKSLLKDQDSFKWRFNVAALEQNYPHLIAAPECSQQAYNGPCLFVKGANSNYILPEHKTSILTLFPAAQAKVIHGAGHWLHAEKPAAFIKIVKDFLLR